MRNTYTLVVIDNPNLSFPENERFACTITKIIHEERHYFYSQGAERLEEIVIQPSISLLEQLSGFMADKPSDKPTVFFINVNILTNVVSDELISGGILVYRYLLKILFRPADWHEQRNNYRFVFYSFLPLQVLMSEAPETISLDIHSFIRLPFSSPELNAAIEQAWQNETFQTLPTEQMLAGWASSLHPEPTRFATFLLGKKIVVIDDYWKEWQVVYKFIFGENNHYSIHFLFEGKTKEDIVRIFDGDGLLSAEQVNLIREADLIITDLYLKETHGEGYSTIKNAANISGYKMFQAIRHVDFVVPVLMITSSTRIWNYKIFDALGIDAWCVKPYEVEISRDVNRIYYDEFAAAIKSLLEPDFQVFIDIGRKIQDLEHNKHYQQKWWYGNIFACFQTGWYEKSKQNAQKNTNRAVHELLLHLKGSFTALRRCFYREIELEGIINQKQEIDAFTCRGIIAQLALIPEIIYQNSQLSSKDILDPYLHFLFLLRNVAAHSNMDCPFAFHDVLVSLGYLMQTLLSNTPPHIGWNAPDRFGNDALIINHLCMYNHPASKMNPIIRRLQGNRIRVAANHFYPHSSRELNTQYYALYPESVKIEEKNIRYTEVNFFETPNDNLVMQLIGRWKQTIS